MDSKKVMVCVCTYNEEDNIRQCIRQIKKNGLDNILVVDASTDNTRKIAEKERGGVGLKPVKRGLHGRGRLQ